MKNALPENAKIAKEAKECMQECVSEFISFITSEGKCGRDGLNALMAIFWLIFISCSVGKVPPRKAQDSQWRGYSLCHDLTGLRELL